MSPSESRSRRWIVASESVSRPRNRRSSSATFGGRMKIVCASGARLSDLLRALPVDLEQNRVARVAQLVDVLAARAVPVVEHLRVLEERVALHELLELRLRSRRSSRGRFLLGLARLTSRVRDREPERRVALEQLADERRLAGARWRGDHPKGAARGAGAARRLVGPAFGARLRASARSGFALGAARFAALLLGPVRFAPVLGFARRGARLLALIRGFAPARAFAR